MPNDLGEVMALDVVPADAYAGFWPIDRCPRASETLELPISEEIFPTLGKIPMGSTRHRSLEGKWRILVDEQEQVRLQAKAPPHHAHSKREQRRWIVAREEYRDPRDDGRDEPAHSQEEEHEDMWNRQQEPDGD